MKNNEFRISLYPYSERIFGYYNGYPVCASISRELGRYILKMKPDDEEVVAGFIDSIDRYESVYGLIRIEGKKVTGFYPCDFEESYYGPLGLL